MNPGGGIHATSLTALYSLSVLRLDGGAEVLLHELHGVHQLAHVRRQHLVRHLNLMTHSIQWLSDTSVRYMWDMLL